MSEDPTRAVPRPVDPDSPAHGLVGPEDPHEDPATYPVLLPPGRATTPPAVDEDPTVQIPSGTKVPQRPDPWPDPVVTRSRTGGVWIGFILSAVVGVVLLVFIVQNPQPVTVSFLGFSVERLPIGVAMLFAAIAGLLLVAIPAGLRILQLRRAARRAARRH